jgi:hypothetical protein
VLPTRSIVATGWQALPTTTASCAASKHRCHCHGASLEERAALLPLHGAAGEQQRRTLLPCPCSEDPTGLFCWQSGDVVPAPLVRPYREGAWFRI